jgi:hypothetical protein
MRIYKHRQIATIIRSASGQRYRIGTDQPQPLLAAIRQVAQLH